MEELQVLVDNTIKSGWKTSEFKAMVVGQIIPILVLSGVLSASDAVGVENNVVSAIEGFGVLLLSLGSLWKYIDSRTKVKVAVEQSKGVIESAAVQLE